MAGRFRHAPPVADTRWIRRERLHRRLLRRFDVPLVVVTAPAGYGKTSLLASVIGEHADDPERIDRWLQCDVADGDAEVLGAALSASIGYPVEAGTMVTAAHLADRLAAQAPAQVSVVLDDFHLVPDSSAGLRLVGELIVALPSNAHLVLSGRERPNLPLARRLVLGELEHLDRSDLAFDDEELVEVHADERGHRRAIAEADPASDPARWPALVALERQHGPVAPADFILEEVAGALGAVRRSALAAVACLHDIDDDVVRAASDRQLTAQQLFDGLPLVHRSPAGTYQLHQLWREALVPGDDVVGDAEVAAALMRVASQRRAANPVESAELSARAGDTEGVEAAAVFLAGRALMFTFTSELRRMSEVCERLLPSHPVTQLVRAALLVNTDELASAEAFERAAMAARDAGDHSVEALALVHAANMRAVIDPARVPGWISERADELLAEGVTAVRLASVLLRSLAARVDGRPDDALKVLGELTAPRVPMETVMLSFGVSDLGRPELVPLPTDAAEARAVAVAGGGQAVAQAMWFRGLVSPEVAISANRDHSETPEQSSAPHVVVSIYSVWSTVALAAGDVAGARQLADAALRAATATASHGIRRFADLADASCACLEFGDQEAARRFERIIDELPIGKWPKRPHLHTLATIYILVPGSRAKIDRCEFGPAFTTVRDAARAVVAIREHGDPEPARQLPWHDLNLLRAHVLPPHLALLAATATAHGDADAGGAIESIPLFEQHLALARETPDPTTSAWAEGRIAASPVRPAHDITVSLLGSVRLLRGGTEVSEATWLGRDRVRQLLALVVLHRRIRRAQVAELLWPTLDPERAASNLRVNLSHLQKVLEPARDNGSRPWFIRSDGETLVLGETGLTVDVDQFQQACDRARMLDGAGRTARAIEEYRRAVVLVEGDFCQDWPDAAWAEVERSRLRALDVGARSRLGELLLACGEPEEAAVYAAEALRTDGLHEASARLLVRTLDAQGARSQARQAMHAMLDRLADSGLRPERATETLAERLGIAARSGSTDDRTSGDGPRRPVA